MNLDTLEKEIIVARQYREYGKLNDIHQQLFAALMKMDRWFDKYLDLFSEKLSEVDKSDPIRRLYNAKFDEYSKISHLIRVTRSYMPK